MTARAVPTMHGDNDRVRVTEWVFSAGAATGWHRHEFDYVITPVTSAPVGIVDAEGEETAFQMIAGTSYFREAGIEHDVINRGEGELRFVEVELKSRPG